MHCNFHHTDLTLNLVPQEKLKSCYNGKPYIFPPYHDATVTTGFGLQSTHIYAEILSFGVISGSGSVKRSKSDEQARF